MPHPVIPSSRHGLEPGVCQAGRLSVWWQRTTVCYPEEPAMPAVPLSQVAVHLHPNDNTAVAARNLPAGLDLRHDGTTVALRDIHKGEAVLKYGQIIGFASADIAAGSHVHVHNVAAEAFERDYAFCRDCPPPPEPAPPRTFDGYDRGDGRVGTRNYIAVI